jgi:hypothetical protein
MARVRSTDEALIDWSRIDQARAAVWPKLRLHQIEAGEAKYVRYDFDPGALERLEISHITDMQYGHRNFQRDRFVQYRDWLLSVPHRFVVLGGDIIDAATVLSVGSPYENTEEPMRQIEGVLDLLRPLSEAGRLLGYVGGNHERRTIPTFGDAGYLIAQRLNVPYSRGVQLIDVWYGDHKPFKISLWHGVGSARTKGAKAQMLHRFMSQADSQVYLVGHLHDVVLLFDWRQHRAGTKIKLQKVAGIMSSSFLSYWNSYAEVKALSPSDTMMARVILEPDGHWEVTLR